MRRASTPSAACCSRASSSPGSTACPPTAQQDGHHFAWNLLDVTRSGSLDGKPAGSVLLRSDLEQVWTRLRAQALLTTFLLVMSLGLALLLSSVLQRLVSEPILSLAGTASRVSAEGNYSLRAERRTSDEVGTLADAFNRMMDRIQLRETELSQANEELRREIAERRRAEQERAELLVREREANRLKDEFLATLSHELRTPLNAILGWTRLLRARAVPPDAVDRALEKVERNANAQVRLVEDLLEVSRIASGKLRLDVRPVDLAGLLNIAIESIRPTAEARGVRLEREHELDSLLTTGDPDRLQQVIWNLLSNAVKFTPSGGRVGVSLRRDGDADELKVSDTGIGIDPAFLPHVFDTFRQADASATRTHGGLGLGLSIVRQLVELHGGVVCAESGGAGRGAVFTVRLPVRGAERRLPVAPLGVPEPTYPALATASVLIVDDDADTREMLSSVLERAGARVRSAASAEEGLTVALEILPDALVSDIAMPGRDGYALISQMRAALGRRAPRVTVALSAFAGPQDRDRSVSAGFQHHLAKPFDPLDIVRFLDDLLGAPTDSVSS